MCCLVAMSKNDTSSWETRLAPWTSGVGATGGWAPGTAARLTIATPLPAGPAGLRPIVLVFTYGLKSAHNPQPAWQGSRYPACPGPATVLNGLNPNLGLRVPYSEMDTLLGPVYSHLPGNENCWAPACLEPMDARDTLAEVRVVTSPWRMYLRWLSPVLWIKPQTPSVWPSSYSLSFPCWLACEDPACLQHCAGWCGKQGREKVEWGSWYWTDDFWLGHSVIHVFGSVYRPSSFNNRPSQLLWKNGLFTWPRMKEYGCKSWVPCEGQAGGKLAAVLSLWLVLTRGDTLRRLHICPV